MPTNQQLRYHHKMHVVNCQHHWTSWFQQNYHTGHHKPKISPRNGTRQIKNMAALMAKDVFLTVRKAAISSNTLLHKEKESEDLQPLAQERDTVKSAEILFRYLFVWGQEAAM